MIIGFDAKRAFHNRRGLGNYSRDVIRLLSTYFSENKYVLFNPSKKNTVDFVIPSESCEEVFPTNLMGKLLPSLWRSRGMLKQFPKHNIAVYHGLSQELPWGIQKAGVKTVVTMHDAIFMRYPELYSKNYRHIFIKKNQFACDYADRIIAISEQTKRDIITYFNADESKIDVVYQGCNTIFRQPISDVQKEQVRAKYNLPEQFLLTVGAIERRKNAEVIIESLHRSKSTMPFVLVGAPTAYKKMLEALIETYNMQNQVFFLHSVETSELPVIYALAKLFVFPSLFEGFGIPILEALSVGTPVIASEGSCFDEVGGPSTCYVNPTDSDAWAIAIERVMSDEKLQHKMRADGLLFAENFSDAKVANNLMNVYKKFV